MKIAIMQPYFLPYAGYFKLISEVDIFVFLDDVQYKKRSWMNRNKICLDSPFFLTIPIKNCNFNSKIYEIEVCDNWLEKHKNSLIHVYGRKIINHDFYKFYCSLNKHKKLFEISCDSIIWISNYFNFKTKFLYSSKFPSILKKQNRIIEICKHLNASSYYNLPNGKYIYDEKYFEEKNIKLNFIDTNNYQKISIMENIFNDRTSCL